jgi:hypothetical protein
MNALMNDFDRRRSSTPLPDNWEGFAEVDQAIRENRMLEYRVRKSWADPWGRRLTIAVIGVIVVGFSFLAGASLGFW